MIQFLSGCGSLFTSTFEAAAGTGYFLLLIGIIVFEVGLGVFRLAKGHLRKW